MARVLGYANAARTGEALGRFDDALADYRHALDAWDTDYGLNYVFPSAHATQSGQPADTRPSAVDPATNSAGVTKEALTDRVAELARSLAVPGGALVERGRWQLQQHQWDDARKTFEEAIARYPSSALVADARALAHRARVERALVLADIEDAAHDEAAALKELEALSHEPPDFNVSAAAIARAAILWKQGAASQAQTLMKDALNSWRAQQPTSPPPARGSVDEDVLAIRDVVFRPAGGGIYGTGG
jgi:tetratricopeptide (TPR) repeat protein